MNQKIIQYEEKVYKLKQELNTIIQEYESGDIKENEEIYIHKILALKEEIKSIDIQLNILRQKLHIQSTKQAPRNCKQIITDKECEKQKYQYTPPVKTNQTQQAKYQYSKPSPQDKERKDNIENIIGKTIMASIASILIFIGMFYFAPAILPYINDNIKVLLMFVISGIVTGIGAKMFAKDNNNKFNVTLLGCGFGMIYISLYLTAGYFHMLNQYLLYFLVALWSLVILRLSEKAKALKFLSCAGVIISITFATLANSEIPELLVVLYAVVIETIFVIYGFIKHKKLKLEDAMTISTTLSILSILNPGLGTINAMRIIFAILAFVPFVILFYYVNNLKKEKDILIIYISSLLGVSLFLSLSIFKGNIESLILILVYLAVLTIFERKKTLVNKKLINTAEIIPMAIILIASIISVLNVCFYENILENAKGLFDLFVYIILVIITISIIAYAFKYKRKNFKIFASFMAVLVLFVSNNETILFVMSIIIVTSVLSMLYTKQSGNTSKTCLYLYVLMFISYLLQYLDDTFFILIEGPMANDSLALVSMIMFLAINTAICYTKLGRNWFNDKKEPTLAMTASIVNALILIYGSTELQDIDNVVIKMLFIMLLIVPYIIAGKKLMKNKSTEVLAAMLFTVFTMIVLSAYSAPSLIITIDSLIASIICILLGFAIDKKSFRIYGLVLSLTSVAKLVLIDIAFKGTLSKALSLFVCAILCLGISYIYNIVDKKYKNK